MKYFCKKCKSYTERDEKKCCLECGADLKDASIAPSTIIAGFKIIEEIGRGSNGVVYLAEQTSLDRQVALKILPDAKAEDPKFVKDFLKEARAVARLNHNNIIQVYDAGVTGNGIYFLAMELVSGKSIEDIILAKGALKSKNAVKVMLELARALEYSWRKEQLSHGDIKPDNVMIRKDGQTKLADFGLAKTIFDEKSEQIMATPMYAPPEVIRAEHKKIGFKSDMYSFGVTFYEMLYGAPPFNEGDCQKVMSMHLRQHHTPLIELMPEIDKSLSDLIDKLLKKAPKQRPASWADVVKILEAIQAKKAKTKQKQNWAAGIFMAMVICALLVIGYLYYQNQYQEAPPKRVKKLVTIKPKPKVKVKKPPVIKISPDHKVAAVKKDDKSHLKFKSLLKDVENLDGDILTASRLRYKALILENNNSFSKSERDHLRLLTATIDNYILKKQKETGKEELSDFASALEKEKTAAKKRRLKIQAESSLTARQNKIFVITSRFLARKESDLTVKALQSLLSKAGNFDKKLKEYKALVFLLKVLPRKYNREGAVFEHLDQLIGKKLPWKINRREYSIMGGSWQSVQLKTQLSEGVFSRKKLRATNISNYHWRLMVDEFLIKGNIKTSRKNIMQTACWLLLHAKDKLFNDFIKKYYPDDLPDWLNCRKLVSSAPQEVAACNLWRNIVAKMQELSPDAYKWIEEFQTKYSQTEVYKNSKTALAEYGKIVYTIYPDAFIKQLNISSLSQKSSNSRIFTIQNRYRFLYSVSTATRIFLRNLFFKKLSALAGNREFVGEFGIFKDVPCGMVYGWMATSNRPPKLSLLRYVPALIDVDNWNYIKRIFKDTAKLKLDLSELKGNPEQYPYSLYCNGLVALRYGNWEIMDKVFSDYNELLLKDDIDSTVCRSLFADFTLKTRGDQYAWEVLSKYKYKEAVQTDEIVIPLLKIQALLTQNPVNEPAISKLIDDIQKRFSAKPDLSGDLKALALLQRFICAGFEPSTAMDVDIFQKTVYPHLHARLWLEAAARDRILQRNSIKIPDLIKASRSVLTPSAFRSELFHKIIFLELGYKNLTPAQLSSHIKKILLELEPNATNSYPSLLMLLFSSEIFNHNFSASKLAPFAKAYIGKCPVFSPLEEQFYNILNEQDSSKVLNYCQLFSPITFQKMYIWILAAAKEKRAGNPGKYIVELKSFRKDLRWTEQLLLNRFIQLIENCP